MTGIVLAACLATAALSSSATAAVGLVAPGLEQIELTRQRGLLIDPNTRIAGLVAAETPRSKLSVRADPNARVRVAALERKLRDARDARAWASAAVGLILGALVLLALWSRSTVVARASVLYAPAAIGLGLAWRSALAIGFGALAVALGAALPRRAFPVLLVAIFAGAVLLLWQWPLTNDFATIGPHPDGGHRFYGITNQVETMLLAPALLGGLAAAVPALVAVGWSKAGADGGGLVVYAVGYALLMLGFGRRRLALAFAVAVAAALALLLLDLATGGSSHVTHALGGGLPGDLAHRWNVSYHGATRSWGAFAMFAVGVLLLLAVARSARTRIVNAMLLALLVSFVVNDTPQDVALWGGLGALALLGFERARVS